MTFKSLLTASVLGVVSVVASCAAFANDQSSTFCKPGFYAGLQGGRSDTFYSGKALVPVSAYTSNTTYIHGDAFGPFTITTTTTDSETVSGQSVDDIGIGGRVYAGYQFNPYFAVEVGYTQYAKTTFNANSTAKHDVSAYAAHDDTPNDHFADSVDNTTSDYHAAGEISEHAVDLVGKATLPLDHGVGLYAKAGAAYISASRHVNSTFIAQNVFRENNGSDLIPDQNINTSNKTIESKSYQAFRPTAGVGANYAIPNSNISVDASYSRVFSSGAIPQASLLALGAEYKFS